MEQSAARLREAGGNQSQKKVLPPSSVSCRQRKLPNGGLIRLYRVFESYAGKMHGIMMMRPRGRKPVRRLP